jgi:predicted metalloprotease
MQWRGRRQSGNVDDQRGNGGGGGGLGGLPIKGGLGLVIVVVVIGLITGKNPLSLLQNLPIEDGNSISQTTPYEPTAEEEELAQFVKVVLADTEDVWHQLMPNYREPTLVLFSGSVQSACGNADASSGPFYCSEDEKVSSTLFFIRNLGNVLMLREILHKPM